MFLIGNFKKKFAVSIIRFLGAGRLRALAALLEDLGLISSTHVAAHSLATGGTRNKLVRRHICRQNTHTYKVK